MNYDELSEKGFPRFICESVIDRVPLDPWDMKFQYLDKPRFDYTGQVVVDDKREQDIDEHGNVTLNENIEEVLVIRGDTYDNKVLITRCGWEGRCVSLIFVMESHFPKEEKLHIWAPTFDELFDAFLQDPYGPDTHVEIMEEMIEKIGNGEKFDTFELVDKYDPCKDIDYDEWVFARYPQDSIIFHPAVYHALMRQIMISEDVVYNKPYHDGRKRPLKEFKEKLNRAR
ncbi:hypothetical protein ACWKT7_28355 [Bacillus toyonensis]|uniref:hypothetical protein n=1 Tax=Bacillus cereus group sp. MG6 TaxID=3040246 RepID=UPI003391931A